MEGVTGADFRTTFPSASSVSVSTPVTTSKEYLFSCPVRYEESLVAFPSRTGRTPAADGSSVPACPNFLKPQAEAAAAAAFLEVTPGDLSSR